MSFVKYQPAPGREDISSECPPPPLYLLCLGGGAQSYARVHLISWDRFSIPREHPLEGTLDWAMGITGARNGAGKQSVLIKCKMKSANI